jgi:hypothetical protein
MLRKVIWSAIILLILLITISVVIFFSRPFLENTDSIKSDVLIIESWIQPFEIEQSISIINSDSVNKVFCIGQNYPDDCISVIENAQNHFTSYLSSPVTSSKGIWLYTNSSLIFNLKKLPPETQLNDSITLQIRAKGSSAAGYCSHFNVIANGKFIGDAFTSERDSAYTFQIILKNRELQSLIVRFENDLVQNNQDRNLQLLSVRVGESEIIANEQTTYLIKIPGRFSTGFNSMADEKRNYLTHLGVPANKLYSVPFKPFTRNQTFAAAKAFKDYNSIPEFLSANILSSGVHSRRTLITYQKVLGKNWQIGVISHISSDYKSGSQEKAIVEFLHLVDEFFSYIFNWIYLSVDGIS